MNSRKQNYRTLAIAIGLLFLLSMSIPSFAEAAITGFSPPPAPSTALRTATEGYGLALTQAVICPGGMQRSFSRPQTITQTTQLNLEEALLFQPGDVLLIPVNKGTYDAENNFTASTESYTSRGVPTNWSISAFRNDTVVEEVKWYLGQEERNENVLYIMISFKKVVVETERLPVSTKISLQDSSTIAADSLANSNTVELVGGLENVSAVLLPNTMNPISSPMILTASDAYAGEKAILSFGEGVLFRDAVLQPNQRIYLNLDRSFDNDIANKMKRFDLQFYNFAGESDHFAEQGQLSVPADSQEACIYEITQGTWKRLPASYNEENATLTIKTNTLGCYVVSNA